jgi:hypothetical protein
MKLFTTGDGPNVLRLCVQCTDLIMRRSVSDSFHLQNHKFSNRTLSQPLSPRVVSRVIIKSHFSLFRTSVSQSETILRLMRPYFLKSLKEWLIATKKIESGAMRVPLSLKSRSCIQNSIQLRYNRRGFLLKVTYCIFKPFRS